MLEIGPGDERIPGFETMDIKASHWIDYFWDATRRMPFPDGTFDCIYASHVIEHIPWYKTKDILVEWVRILKAGGSLDIWVPDGLKICKAFLDAEAAGNNYIYRDGWYRFNEERDPCKWFAGRTFSYGDGTGRRRDPNWHLAVFSQRYLQDLLKGIGLRDVSMLESRDVRGYDHGWINMGVRGVK